KVLAWVGACNYRDVIDQLIVGDVKDGKASCTASGNSPGYINTPSDIAQALPELGVNPYPPLKRDTTVDVKDTDGDGMPDSWEKKYGLNPSDKADGLAQTIDKRAQYTNLEMYLNSLVHHIMKECSSF
ncbi:MAG: pectate lyase, partial [Bacteroidaceae bacterium]|nr:pectate lyase [Bacteroidaceae bacterium]